MTEIDRRALITVAGAGLVLTACKPGDSTKTPTAGPTWTDGAGSGLLYGQPVRATAPSTPGHVTEFNPEKICFVMLRFDAGGALTVRRTYIPVPAPKPTQAQIKTAVIPQLKRLSANTSTKPEDRDNIDPINLFGQRVLVIYLDNNPATARFKYDPDPRNEVASYDYTLRFAPYSGADPKREIKENHAFFNVRKIPFVQADGLTGKEAFVLEFWNSDERGEPIDAKEAEDRSHYRYSLNILLEVLAGTRWVPIIVDPDTGNMGAEP